CSATPPALRPSPAPHCPPHSPRHLTELLADADAARNADEAICILRDEGRDEADRTALRLLLGALGIFPTGSLVELSNGLICEVVAVSENPLEFGLPVVRPVMDPKGGGVSNATHALAERRRRGETLSIHRVVELGGTTAPAEPRVDDIEEDWSRAARADSD